MKQVFKTIFICSFILLTAVNVQAQKIAYANTAEILTGMPEMAAAEKEIQTMQQNLQGQGESLYKTLQSNIQVLQEKIGNGQLSPEQQQVEIDAIAKQENELKVFESKMAQALDQRRNQLLEPIYAKVNKTIAAVAKENGYAMILSHEAVLFSEDAQNVTALIQAKL